MTLPTPATPVRVYAVLALVQVLFAFQYLAAKVVLRHIEPSAWAAIRVVGATALFFLFTWRYRQEYPRDTKTLLTLMGLSFLGVVFNQVLFIEGLARTVPSHSSLIMVTIPVATLLLAVLGRQERSSPRKLIAVGLSLLGVLILLGDRGFELGGPYLTGDLMTMTNAVSFSAFLVLSRDLLRRIPPVAAAPLLFALGSIPICLYGAPALARTDLLQLPPLVWLLGAGIIVGPTFAAYFLNYWALARVESSRVALFIYLQFLIAAPLSWWLLDETPSWRLAPAALLVFAGVGLSVGAREESGSTKG